MKIADFNPSIIFFILWGILSWLTKNKKNKPHKLENNTTNTIPNKKDIFSQLQKLQNHLSNNIDGFPNKEDYIEDEPNITIESEPILEQESTTIDYPISDTSDIDSINSVVIEKKQYKIDIKNWLRASFSNKNNIKKAIILSEILDKPRGLNPYKIF